jgi:uroporphyrinogen III methyltransferase/synthase
MNRPLPLPLAGRRVVVTRFEMEGGPLATALRRVGAEPLVVPLIGIDPVIDASADTPRPLCDFDWLAFTSANGVRMFVARLDTAARATFRSHGAIAAVGPATARAVAAAGARSALIAPEFVAESLADALGDVRGKRILWPRAAGARSVLSDTLRHRGADVVEQILYDTVALTVPEATRSLVMKADAITFTRPSAVRAFVACFGVQHTPRIACIGPVTAAAARDAGLATETTAAVFTLDGMVRALCSSFNNTPGQPQSSVPPTASA